VIGAPWWVALPVGVALGYALNTTFSRFGWTHLPDDRFEQIITKMRARRAGHWKLKP
jgi:hypothetical protein